MPIGFILLGNYITYKLFFHNKISFNKILNFICILLILLSYFNRSICFDSFKINICFYIPILLLIFLQINEINIKSVVLILIIITIQLILYSLALNYSSNFSFIFNYCYVLIGLIGLSLIFIKNSSIQLLYFLFSLISLDIFNCVFFFKNYGYGVIGENNLINIFAVLFCFNFLIVCIKNFFLNRKLKKNQNQKVVVNNYEKI